MTGTSTSRHASSVKEFRIDEGYEKRSFRVWILGRTVAPRSKFPQFLERRLSFPSPFSFLFFPPPLFLPFFHLPAFASPPSTLFPFPFCLSHFCPLGSSPFRTGGLQVWAAPSRLSENTGYVNPLTKGLPVCPSGRRSLHDINDGLLWLSESEGSVD
ncbi:uncharacterized protein BO95DRAFT_80047 [Aspergillus brunneoviolaceus CBS 621.78]|uniref:Uncharacterized protein n=1 Tax=Aspergillus brunneoviolaceus CBS 621.78 TaxID=1450534 RepID=A0ACD1GEA0_9EURO|nr:hypothetical protein BO95DRAFT_80047 [Aspergillus brunneoviolaceus CBS 621.78]RAH47591.1 hypothetical protein BO95DRAFT_80047 [Aspergillus brunneoviolaceus CBS 621.78]